MKAIIYIVLFIVVLSHPLIAQFSSSLEVNSAYDDNVFRSPELTEDVVSDLNVDLGYKFNKTNFRFYYNGNFIFYRNLKERNLSLHRLGANYFFSFGKDNLHTFFIGGSGLTRIDGEEYKEYDYSQLYAYANVRVDIESLFLKAGYNIRYRDYSNIPELNNLRHYIFLQTNKSFESRTTLILEADFGYKAFTSPIIFTTQDSLSTNGGGNGNGPGMSTRPSQSITLTSGIPPMSHLIILARVAQSLFDKMGIYIQYRKQINFSDQVTSLTGNDYYQDEELFDDPFSFESQGISTQLTWIMPWIMRLQIGGSFIDKSYISETAYTSIDDSVASGGLRMDTQSNLFLNFTKTFNFKRSWLNTLMFNFYIGLTNNESNSYWYNYTNRVMGGGIQFRF